MFAARTGELGWHLKVIKIRGGTPYAKVFKQRRAWISL
jgi:hypothetical protein